MLKAISICDHINTCDCCGKTKLKCTVEMMDEMGEVYYYGTTCAARNSGKLPKDIKAEIEKNLADRIDAAKKEYHSSLELIACNAKIDEANKNKISVGKEFMEYCKNENEAESNKKREIAKKYNIAPYQFY